MSTTPELRSEPAAGPDLSITPVATEGHNHGKAHFGNSLQLVAGKVRLDAPAAESDC
ncbi:MAG: hypothetical protein ACK46L_03900 [Synechococcaceae cyanobacterium]|jgi:hypothetical protein